MYLDVWHKLALFVCSERLFDCLCIEDEQMNVKITLRNEKNDKKWRARIKPLSSSLKEMTMDVLYEICVSMCVCKEDYVFLFWLKNLIYTFLLKKIN